MQQQPRFISSSLRELGSAMVVEWPGGEFLESATCPVKFGERVGAVFVGVDVDVGKEGAGVRFSSVKNRRTRRGFCRAALPGRESSWLHPQQPR